MLTKGNVLLWMPRLVFFVIAAICIGQYLHYINAILSFPYDWEPTDGDHLNFAHRLAQGLPIYLSIRSGEVLSIYNPLYHGIVALLGGEHASLSFARTIAFVFWALCPLTVFFYFRKSWGHFYALIAALFIWLPAEPMMLVDIVQVSPNSTMAFMFLATLLYAEHCSENQNTQWWGWILLGGISALCYLAKQQGIIAFVSVMAFLLIKPRNVRALLLTALGFLLVFILSTAYLEWLNSGEYLKSTLIDLHRIMITYPLLAQQRLRTFVYDEHFYFLVGVFASFAVTRLQPLRLTVWHVSYILHIPLLLSILGNGGGGPNYFVTFWIVTVLICVGLVKELEGSQGATWSVASVRAGISQIFNRDHIGLQAVFVWAVVAWILVFIIKSLGAAEYFLIVWVGGLVGFIIYKDNNKLKQLAKLTVQIKRYISEFGLSGSFVFSQVLLILLFLNISIATLEIRRNLNSISLPTQTLNQLIGNLIESKPNARVLTNRNIGALVEHGADVRNEGSTTFSYAWEFPRLFPHEVLLSSIRTKKYDLITTGIQPYPAEVRKAIYENYQVAFTKDVNIYFGKVGQATVYIPK
jgi:hypothetical protein